MTGLTWLHLSDWHQRGKDFDRTVVRDRLIKDIKNREDINKDLAKIDFIIFSGDIAFSGLKEEYRAAKKELFEPLLEACELDPNELFIVPGNHDIDWKKFELLPKSLLNPFESDAEAKDWLFDKEKRSLALKPFKAFRSFVSNYAHQDNPHYSNISQFEVDGRKVALLGLNSAWMCGRRKDSKGEIDDNGVTIVGEPQIHDSLEKISKSDIKIAVMHHPFDWLADLERNQIENSIMRVCNFILRGHQHNPEVSVIHSTCGDCIVIPAGSCYDRRAYANAYNFVHLNFESSRGIVFLRCWNGKDKWREDVDSYPGGKFEFQFSGSPTNESMEPQCDHGENEPRKEHTGDKNPTIIPKQIPPPPRDFKGREDEIRDILSNFEKGATITGLRGMGGVGKTALALELAEKIKNQFPDGQIFIEMRGTSKNPDLPSLTPDETMAHVIRAFNLADKLPENSNELCGLYHSILDGKRVLLLLDNAANGEQVEPLIPPKGCSVLITSRIKFTLPGLAEKDLDTLQPEKARELLLEIAPRIGNRAAELAKLCGYLPLALRNAGKALSEKKDLGISEYEERLRGKRERLELVKASFSLSYDLLSPGRKKQWCRLSVFPEGFDRSAATAILKMAPGPSAEALSDLVRWSLVDFVPSAGFENGRYKLHDLARLFAESCLKQDELADARKKHSQHYSKILSQAENLYKKGGADLFSGLELFDREWDNIKVGQAWVKNIIRSYRKLSKSNLKFATQLAGSYAGDGMNILDLRLHPREIIGWIETGLNATRINGDQSNEGVHLGNIGNACVHLGETRKAIDYYNQQLKITQKTRNRRSEGISLGNLGSAYSNLGDLRKSIDYYDQALAIAREIGDRRGEGVRLGNLGSTYLALCDVRKAIGYHEQSLKISLEIGDRRGEGSDLGCLGLAYAVLGETRKAIEYCEHGLAIAREIGDKRNQAIHLGNLGLAYADLGETRKAIKHYEQALKISREIGDKQNEGESLCNFGKAYSNLNETDKAIECCTQSLDIVRKIEYLQIEGESLCTLGKVYSQIGEINKAIEHCDQALEIFQNMEFRRGEADAFFYKSQALDKLNQRPQAIDCAQKALQIFEQIESPKAEKVRQQLTEWQAPGPQEI